MCLVYGAIGSENLDDVYLTFTHLLQIPVTSTETILILIGLSSICISLLFKLGAVPFHTWVADVFEGSFMPITAFFATASKIGVLTVFIRILNFTSVYSYLLTAIGLASLVIGSLNAMRQMKIKRLMAFSGIVNMGWIFLALITNQWLLVLFHMLIYIALSLTLFSIFITPLCKKYSTILFLKDFNFINNPSVTFAVIIAMFSLSGMPPLAGFYTKYLIIYHLALNQFYLTLSIALAVAVISTFYYLRVIKHICFSTTQSFTFQVLSLNAIIISFTTLVSIGWFWKPNYFCVWLF
jgi:NADH-quinone oxidoreductase subunit N